MRNDSDIIGMTIGVCIWLMIPIVIIGAMVGAMITYPWTIPIFIGVIALIIWGIKAWWRSKATKEPNRDNSQQGASDQWNLMRGDMERFRRWEQESHSQIRRDVLSASSHQPQRQRQTEAERLDVWIGLGMSPVNIVLSHQLGLPTSEGVFVKKVMSGSPSEIAGLLAGDVIRAVDDVGVTSPSQIETRLRSRSAGQLVNLTVWRAGVTKRIPVILSGTAASFQRDVQSTESHQSERQRQTEAGRRWQAETERRWQAEAERQRQAAGSRVSHYSIGAENPEEANLSADTVSRRKEAPPSIIPEKEMLEFLLNLSGYTAWCCGFANRMADGTVVKDTSHFHLDHIDPKSKGGSNQITNRAPMCAKHNLRKSNRRVHLEEYRVEIAARGELKVPKSELVDLTMAYQQALDHYAKAQASHESAGTTGTVRRASSGRKAAKSRSKTTRRRTAR